jgi:PAS domain S-box-containing protein
MTITLDADLKAQLEEEAKRTGMSQRRLVENALRASLDPNKITTELPADLYPAWADYQRDFPGVTLKQAVDWGLRGDFTAKGYPRSLDGQINVSELPAGITHVTTSDGFLMGVSDSWLSVFGYKRHEVENRNLAEFYTPDSQRRLEKNVGLEIKDRPDMFKREIVRKDGSIVPVVIELNKRKDQRGNYVAAIAELTVVKE